MANLSITTSVSGLGTSNSWTTAATTNAGDLYNPTPYLGVSVSSAASSGWSVGALTSPGVNAALASFSAVIPFASVPTSWTSGTGFSTGPVLATSTTYNCSLYWTDASGNQQYAIGIPLGLTISAGVSYTWACSSVNCYYASAALTAQTSSAPTVTSIVVCPEVVAPCDICGDGVSGNSITDLTIASSRTGAVALVGAYAGGTNASSSSTTFTFGSNVTIGTQVGLTTSHSITILAGTGVTLGTYAISGVGSLPTSVSLTGLSGTGSNLVWYASLTAGASKTFYTTLVGSGNGVSSTASGTNNVLYGTLAQTARSAGAIIVSTADTSTAVAPNVCAYHN